MRKIRTWPLALAAALVAGARALRGASKTLSRRMRIVILSAVLVSASIFAVPVSAAYGSSRNSCDLRTDRLYHECTNVVSSGLKITSITGHLNLQVGASGYDIHIEVYGPHGHIANCPEYTQIGTTGPNCGYSVPNPTANQAAGYYCTRAWQRTGSLYTALTSACVAVQPSIP